MNICNNKQLLFQITIRTQSLCHFRVVFGEVGRGSVLNHLQTQTFVAGFSLNPSSILSLPHTSPPPLTAQSSKAYRIFTSKAIYRTFPGYIVRMSKTNEFRMIYYHNKINITKSVVNGVMEFQISYPKPNVFLINEYAFYLRLTHFKQLLNKM